MDLTAALQQMINAAVDERIGQVTARADAMVRLHGEYVKIPDAATIMNVSVSTVRRMMDDGRLQAACIGVSVRSIAALTDIPGAAKQRTRRTPAAAVAKFERIRP